MAETIKCTCCGKELPHTHEYFNWQNKSENNLRTICRECYNAQKRKTDSPWHKETWNLPPAERAKARSKTFPGVARAMAEQWG